MTRFSFKRPLFHLSWLAASAFTLLLSGCGPRYIKGTKVVYSDKNKAVVDVINQYAYLFRMKQWEKLLKLVSPRFVETRGTPDPKDDYGYATLQKKMLSPEMRQMRIIRFKIHIDKIEYPSPKEAHVYIRNAYTFLYPRGKYRPGLNTGVIRQKMVLEFDRGRWLFRQW